MWRKFLRNLCPYSTMMQKVLPHNVAWPFFSFFALLLLASLCRHIMRQKKSHGHKVGPMLKQRVLTDNMTPQIFCSQLTRNPVAKKFLEVSPYYAAEMAIACRKTLTFARVLAW